MGTVRYTVLDGEILSENRNGVKRDYVPDPLGSTVALLDNTQTQTDTYSFWPYGETRTSTGTTPTPFNFIGTKGYYADTAGISLKKYVRARYYDTFRSRWLTEDPIGFDGGDDNLYRYVKSNPTSKIGTTGYAIPWCAGYKCTLFGVTNGFIFRTCNYKCILLGNSCRGGACPIIIIYNVRQSIFSPCQIFLAQWFGPGCDL